MENYNAYYAEINTLNIGRRELFLTKNHKVYYNKKDIPKSEKFDKSIFEIYIINDNAVNYSNYLKSLEVKAITDILCLNNESKMSFVRILEHLRDALEDFYSDITKYLKAFKENDKVLSKDIEFSAKVLRTYNAQTFALREMSHSFVDSLRVLTNNRMQSLREITAKLNITIERHDESIFKKLSYLEVIDINQWWLGYMLMQYEKQLQPYLYHPDAPTKPMYGIEDMIPKLRLVNFEIASEIPFFNLSELRIAVRGILLATANHKHVQKILKTIFEFSNKVIDLYNDEISRIEKDSGLQRKNERAGKKKEGMLPIVTENVSIRIDNDKKVWIVNDTIRFYRKNPKALFNRDFAIFAANVFNFLKEEVFINEESKKVVVENRDNNTPVSFEEMFFDSELITPCLKVLTQIEKPALNSKFEWIGNNKSLLCVWIKELYSGNTPFIKKLSNKDYAQLLLKKIPSLKSFSHTNFDKPSTRANALRDEIKYLLSKLSESRMFGK